MENVVHFRWKDMNKSEGIQKVEYVNTGDIHISNMEWSKYTGNIPRIQNKEAVYMFY